MKYLIYAAGIIAILGLVFITVGIIKPEISYDCEVIVDKPLAESWNVAQDEGKMAEWLDGYQKVEHVSGEPGTVGAVSNVYFITDGQEMSVKETITAMKPNESMEMLFETDFMDMEYKFSMNSVEGKTKITSSTIARGNGMIARSFMAFIGGSVKAQEEANLAKLKKTIEENTKEY